MKILSEEISLILVPYNGDEYFDHIKDSLSPYYLKKYTNRLFPFSCLSFINIEKNDLFLLKKGDSETVVGMIVFRKKFIPFKEGFATYIYGVEIFGEYRGLGYGDILMELSLSLLANNGIKRVYLSVSKNNTPALNLYTKNDFEIVRSKKGNQQIMKRILNG